MIILLIVIPCASIAGYVIGHELEHRRALCVIRNLKGDKSYWQWMYLSVVIKNLKVSNAAFEVAQLERMYRDEQ
jgi:hypothetical protein